MPAYVALIKFTDQGIRNVKETVNRSSQLEKLIESVGGRKIGFWWTMGEYDMVAIAEAPDEATAMRVLLLLGMQGNARTTTLRAFSEDEMGSILKTLT